MLVDVIGDLLPSAIGVAISPVPIVATVLMLGAPRARTQGPAFALGWVVGLVAVSAAAVSVAGVSTSGADPSTPASWIKIAIGALFWVMAVRQWKARPVPGVEPEQPRWMAAADTIGIGRTIAVGAALAGLNPKNLALTLAAAASIAQADLAGGPTTVAVASFVVVGSLTVAGPVAFFLLAPGRAAAPLRSIKEVMSAHNAAIMAVVLVLLGAKLLGNGIAGI